jgi:hypothetical protein
MSTPNPKNVWSRLYDDVHTQIPGVTDAVFKQALYQVWNDFVDRTNIWVEEVSIDVDPSSLVYPFTIQHKGMPNRLLLLYDPAVTTGRYWAQNGVEMNVPGVIKLLYAPPQATWNAVIAKTADETDETDYPALEPADEWIVNKYGDGMHYGVMGRLQAMPGKPYTNQKLGGANWQIYIAERGRARGDISKSNVYGAQRWTYPQSFATVSRKGWT